MKTTLLAMLLLATFSAQAQAQTLAPASVAASSAATPTSVARSQNQIESAVTVADPMFGVHANVLGLERRVEMLQWRKTESTSIEAAAPSHYEQVWTAERIDSSGFDAAHRNTGDLPFNGERWWTSDPKLDGHPVTADVLAALDAWTPLKPDLSQLPANLAVSFQPDGDWLSTSQDPAHPQIGDVRVNWRAIVHAPAPRDAVLIAGRWELPAKTAIVATPAAAHSSPVPQSDATSAWLQRIFGGYLTWIVVAGLALALLLLFWKRRR